MQGQAEIRAREALEQPVLQHAERAADRLLGGLADEDHRAMPLVFDLPQHARRAHQPGHVDVVAAGVHHRHVLALRVFGGHRAGVRQTRLLFDGQRVHVRAEQDSGAGAVAQHPHDPELADAGGDFAAGLAQFLGHARRALHFLEGQFGV